MVVQGANLVVMVSLLWLGLADCGQGRNSDMVGYVPPTAGPPATWTFEVLPTATPWPTFTPLPTATPTPTPYPTIFVPTATPFPTAVPVETLVPEVVEVDVLEVGVPGDGGDEGPAAGVGGKAAVLGVPEPTPSPTPFGKLWMDDYVFRGQTLVPLVNDDVPGYINDWDWAKFPKAAEVINRNTRFVLWVVGFDSSGAKPGFEMEGYVRWTDITPGREELVMHESRVQLSHGVTNFYRGLGRQTPGLWKTGRYKVEFLDNRGVVVVGREFRVR